jgi:endonuclease III
MISLRTKDQVTTAASARLFAIAATPPGLANTPERTIADAIYPAGFYRVKATNIRTVSRILTERHDRAVPRSLQSLLELPGVGRKTANLVLGLGFGIPAICVDTHVHRISNRLGWVFTKTPEQTEHALMAVLPREHWIPINELLVRFGQTVCTPTSPHCSSCPLAAVCPRVGVTRSR